MRAKLFMVTLLVLLIGNTTFESFATGLNKCTLTDSSEVDKVKQTIVESYVEGIFLKGNARLLKKGWHADCDIVILESGKLIKLPAKYWIDRLTKDPGPLDSSVTYKFSNIEVTGYAAIAIVEIYSKGKHLYTDYMCLYKFKDSWKIVTKIFYTHPNK